MNDAVKLRNAMKKIKPNFARSDSHKRRRVSRTGWRHPKGIHSKIRTGFKSRMKIPTVGYSSPRSVRGLTREGFKPVLVHSIRDLEGIKNEIIIIAKSVGMKKRMQLLEKIKQLKLKVRNVKDIDGFIKKAKEIMEMRKKQKKEMKKTKEETKKEKPKEVKKKEETPEEKEKREKEEKRKVLEKR